MRVCLHVREMSFLDGSLMSCTIPQASHNRRPPSSTSLASAKGCEDYLGTKERERRMKEELACRLFDFPSRYHLLGLCVWVCVWKIDGVGIDGALQYL